jgi:hypothetical protein
MADEFLNTDKDTAAHINTDHDLLDAARCPVFSGVTPDGSSYLKRAERHTGAQASSTQKILAAICHAYPESGIVHQYALYSTGTSCSFSKKSVLVYAHSSTEVNSGACVPWSFAGDD